MNIEGVVRQLALFEPPIDPALLVEAAAAGLDIGSVLADLNAPLPLYRFSVLLQKAIELCNEVKALGAALLAALEKKDAEALAAAARRARRSSCWSGPRRCSEQQIDEAEGNLERLEAPREHGRRSARLLPQPANSERGRERCSSATDHARRRCDDAQARPSHRSARWPPQCPELRQSASSGSAARRRDGA